MSKQIGTWTKGYFDGIEKAWYSGPNGVVWIHLPVSEPGIFAWHHQQEGDPTWGELPVNEPNVYGWCVDEKRIWWGKIAKSKGEA